MASARFIPLIAVLILFPFGGNAQYFRVKEENVFELTDSGAIHLSQLPLKCLQKQFPYKTGITFSDSSFIMAPVNYHPAFYGCFDWHSSVHGHWMLVRLLKKYPAHPQQKFIRDILESHLSARNIQKELAIFAGGNKSFERIYGWGWFLELNRELMTWNDPWAQSLSLNLRSLSQHFSKAWVEFLDKLVYPIRVGEHTNLAFGLSLTYDYALAANDLSLQEAIRRTAIRFYNRDTQYPAHLEPGGYDFLSPALEEARLMSRVLGKAEFAVWLEKFLPRLLDDPSSLFTPALVKDVTDGKLVHLHGLNFSRAWCLNEIARHFTGTASQKMKTVAHQHLAKALPHVASGDYAGEHWLGSFAVYALASQ